MFGRSDSVVGFQDINGGVLDLLHVLVVAARGAGTLSQTRERVSVPQGYLLSVDHLLHLGGRVHIQPLYHEVPPCSNLFLSLRGNVVYLHQSLERRGESFSGFVHSLPLVAKLV